MTLVEPEPWWELAARGWERQSGIRYGPPRLEDHQKPPDGDWTLWLLEAGRGAGKTLAMAVYFSRWMRANPKSRGRILAPTFGDAVESAINPPSGLTAVDDEVRFFPSEVGGSKVRWPNGSEALVLGLHTKIDVDRLRASGNRHLDWWEEMAAHRHLGDAWKQAKFGLRLGVHPHSIASTTPRNTPPYKEIRGLPGTTRIHATMYDNPHNPPEWVEEMESTYAATRTGRQELGGELLEDVEGALWNQEMIEAVQWRQPLPEMIKTVTAVDPSGSEVGNETGIVTAGVDAHGVAYVLADDSTRGYPEHRYEQVCRAAMRWGSSRIIFEAAYGGDNSAANIRSSWDTLRRQGIVDTPPPIIEPTNIRGGKADRAMPVVSLYEQTSKGIERIHHLNPQRAISPDAPRPLAKLEDEQTSWAPDDSTWSPNRIDALAYAVRKLTDRLGRSTRGSFGGMDTLRAIGD